MRMIDRCEQCRKLEQGDHRRGERAHQGKPIRRPHHHIKERDRPGHEDYYLEQVCNWAETELVTAERKEFRSEDETQANSDEVEPHRPKNSRTQFSDRMRDRPQETDR